MKRHDAACILIGWLALILVPGCTHSRPDPYGMRFIDLGCVGPAGCPGKTVTDSQWLGTHFIVTVQDSTLACSARITHPGYALDGNDLTLTYTADASKSLAMCNCKFASIFSFRKLPPGASYRMHLKVQKIFPH